MGYKKNITPNIDKLAKEGIIFKKAIANASFTGYSLSSLFTSTLPPVYKDAETITQILRSFDYKTCAVNPNPQGIRWIKKGFETYEMMLPTFKQVKIWLDFLKHTAMWVISKGLSKYCDKFIEQMPFLFALEEFNVPSAKEVNKKAIEWLINKKDGFFLWIHYVDVHDPYLPPNRKNQKDIIHLLIKYRYFPFQLTEEEIKKIIDLYDEEIEYVDKEIGRFINVLKELKIFDDSIIIITADHGEAFLEHGFFGHGGRIIRGMDRTLAYDEVLHVPLIIYGLEKGEIIDKRQVQLLDISPTICDLLGLFPSSTFEGLNLFDPEERGIVSNTLDTISYRTEKLKLIINKKSNKKELYNLENDPDEKINIYNEKDPVAQELENKLSEIFKRKLHTRIETMRIKTKMEKLKK